MMLNGQPIENLSNKSDVQVLRGIGTDSSKTVLNILQFAKIMSRETPK